MMRHTTIFGHVLAASCVFAVVAASGFALTACGGKEKVTPPEQTVAPTTQATGTAPAQERQWSFRGQRE